MPLAVGDSVTGVLTLYASGRNVFTDDHGRLIQMVAPHAAQAINAAGRRAAQPHILATRDLKLVRR